MIDTTTTSRTKLEMEGLACALLMSRGAAPDWLRAELTAAPPAPVVWTPRRNPLETRARIAASLSFAALFTALGLSARLNADRLILAAELRAAAFKPAPKAPAPVPAPAPVAVDPLGLQAVALAQQWRIAGDDRPIFERLGGVTSYAGHRPAWSAERTEGDGFLVLFREPAGTPVYAFEVDVRSGEVVATPEAVERLTLRRVRDEADAQLRLLARSY